MHSLRYSIYHKILRTSAVLVAAVLAFQSGAIVPGTALLGSAAERYLANTVSMSASVVPNSENTLATELKREKLNSILENVVSTHELKTLQVFRAPMQLTYCLQYY